MGFRGERHHIGDDMNQNRIQHELTAKHPRGGSFLCTTFWILLSSCPAVFAGVDCRQELHLLQIAVDRADALEALTRLNTMVRGMGGGRHRLVATPLFLMWPRVYFMPGPPALKDRFKAILRSIEDYMLYDLAAKKDEEANTYLNRCNFLRSLPSIAEAGAIIEWLQVRDFDLYGRELPEMIVEPLNVNSLQDLSYELIDTDDLHRSAQIRYHLRQLQLLFTIEFSIREGSSLAMLTLNELEADIRSIRDTDDENIHPMDEREWNEMFELFLAIGNASNPSLNPADRLRWKKRVEGLLISISKYIVDAPYVIGEPPNDLLRLWTAAQYAVFLRNPEIAQMISGYRYNAEVPY